ncbi:MAG TPA: FimV/HubP family polar landmark protein [Burkholderiales bacterium]|nr:FimV/HubP family polar landmark protein [Burkholderiales bacterium]
MVLAQSQAVYAAGLGKLTVLSSLGQPLRAEIDIVSLQANETESLSAKLASSEAFRQANIELNGALLQVRFAIENRPGGRTVLSITSPQPMNEPFVDMLIELNWASGRLTREYTFLLDPPEYNNGTAVASTPAQPVAPPSVQAQPAPPAPSAPAAEAPKPAEKPAQAQAPAAPAAAAPAASKPAAGSYTVKKGDTLSKIANSNRVDGVSLQQMLAALYQGNKDAFDGQNMNRLRTGQILNLPSKDEAQSMSQEEASRLVASQGADFNQYRRSLGAAVAEAPSRADTGRQASGKIGAPPAEEKPAPAAPAKDQLKLSKVEDGKAGGKAAESAGKDNSAAKAAALKEANERAAALEKNVADMKKLAEMKSQAGAQLQQQAQAAKADAAKADAAKADASKAGAAKADAGKAPVAPAPAPAADAAKAAATPSATPSADAGKAAPAADAAKAGDASKAGADAAKPPAPAAAAPKAPPKPAAPPPPPPPETGFLDDLTGNPAALGGAGLVVILLGVYAGYAVRKKRKAKPAAASDIDALTSGANSVFGPAGGASIDTNSSQFQSDFAPGTPAPGESEEIDPVAEADVYMAYGRDTQAEEILKEALAKDGTRQAVRVKLLEIYANRKDVGAFSAVANELHQATGGRGPEWEKAAALGVMLDPSNPLYGGSASAPGVMDTQVLPGSAPSMESTVVLPGPVGQDAGQAGAQQALSGADEPTITTVADLAPQAPAAPAASAEEPAPPALDFDLDLGAPETPQAGVQPDISLDAPAPAEAAAPSLDFDLNLDAPPAEAKPAEAQPAADQGLSIDFELPSDEPAAQAGAAAAAEGEAPMLDFDLGSPTDDKPLAEPPALDLSSINLDLGATDAPAAAPDAHWQEVATKLDLAKAYQEMGDKEGARELLKEVMNEGDAAQQQQARTMIEAVS